MEATGEDIGIGQFWRTLGERPIGATVVTARGEDGPNGFLGLSAAHVTANPPTMLVSVDRKTSALKPILDSGHFAINFLPEGRADMANAFGGKGDKVFAEGDWGTLATGAPVFDKALGVFDCTVDKVVDHGETAIVIGTVKGVRAAGEGAPLVFFRGAFLSD